MKDDRGSAAMELVLIMPVLLSVLLLVVAGGRLTVARGDLDAAAREGARAASIARTPAQAKTAAEEAITTTLDSHHISCNSPSFDIDVGALAPGSEVAATVHCEVSFSDLTLLPLPARHAMTARFVEVVDTYRQAS